MKSKRKFLIEYPISKPNNISLNIRIKFGNLLIKTDVKGVYIIYSVYSLLYMEFSVFAAAVAGYTTLHRFIN